MARPRKDIEQRRTETIALRLALADRLRLEYAATAAGRKPAEYARRRTLSGKVVVIPGHALPLVVFDELRRISVNLHQLIRAASQAGPIPPALASVSALIEHILVREVEQAPRRARRTKKDADALLIATIRFRVTPAESREITGKATAAGITASEYARRQTLDGKVAVVAQGRAIDPAALDELQAAGISVNRQARIANQTGRVSSDLPHLCAALERIVISHGMGEAPARRAKRQAPAPAPGGP